MLIHTPTPSTSPPSPVLSPTVLYIVVYSAPVPNYWLFNYCLNFLPFYIEQKVALFHRAADCFTPDGAIAQGQIEAASICLPFWTVFKIVCPDANMPVINLGVP
jgi:hypothetical protein